MKTVHTVERNQQRHNMSNKQNDIINEDREETFQELAEKAEELKDETKGFADIRYRAHCAKCGKKLSDWALQLPEDRRFCYDCQKPSFERFKKVWK